MAQSTQSQLSAKKVIQRIRAEASPERAEICRRFFKTGKGDYSEGDQFCGVRVPVLRTIAREYRDLPFTEVRTLLHSRVHEDRMVAVFIMLLQYKRGDVRIQDRIRREYLRSIKSSVNNWDLVDASAEHIIGEHVVRTGDMKLLRTLARSKSLWERRVAMIATFACIKSRNPKPTLEIAELLLRDTHDLMHKAVGWMLREMGKRCSKKDLTIFLDTHVRAMPRTALRYAIEHFSVRERTHYMNR